MKDLPGLETIFNLAITLLTFEENMYTSDYAKYITKIPTKGLSKWGIHFSKEQVKPYSVNSYKAVSKRLDEILL